MKQLDKLKNQLRNLKQNRNLSDEEIEAKAKEKLEKNEILSHLTFCIDNEERKFASHLLEKYLEESSLESTSEKDTLRQLIDVEVLMERIKKFLNTEYIKANPVIPTQMLDQLTTLNKQVIDLKDNLGLSKKDEQKNILDKWDNLKSKALAYYKENAGCNIAKCPECQKLFYILKDMRNHKTEKIPFFKKTLLYNKKLYELYEQNKITKEEMIVILGVSGDYVDYIFETVYKNDK